MIALAVPNLGVARAVGLAFAVAASTFCPLLVLGIWWRRLTDVGAVAGLLVGFVGSGSAVLWAMASRPTDGAAILLEQPAAWSVPLAFATMVVVSLAHARSGCRRTPAASWPGCTPRSCSTSTVRRPRPTAHRSAATRWPLTRSRTPVRPRSGGT